MAKQAYKPGFNFQQYYSELVLGYVASTDIGYCFREVELTMTDTLKFGSVLQADLTEVASAAGSDDAEFVFVWADQPFGLDVLGTGTVFRGVVVKTGVTLDRRKVVYADGSAINDAAVESLEANGLKLTDKVLQPTT